MDLVWDALFLPACLWQPSNSSSEEPLNKESSTQRQNHLHWWRRAKSTAGRKAPQNPGEALCTDSWGCFQIKATSQGNQGAWIQLEATVQRHIIWAMPQSRLSFLIPPTPLEHDPVGVRLVVCCEGPARLASTTSWTFPKGGAVPGALQVVLWKDALQAGRAPEKMAGGSKPYPGKSNASANDFLEDRWTETQRVPLQNITILRRDKEWCILAVNHTTPLWHCIVMYSREIVCVVVCYLYRQMSIQGNGRIWTSYSWMDKWRDWWLNNGWLSWLMAG